jgi:hypothetical protein
MILSEIRKDCDLEGQAARAVLGEGVRGYFHDACRAILLDHPGQHPVQADGIGRGVRRRVVLLADARGDGPQQPGRAVVEHLQHVMDEPGSGGLSVGAGYADHAQRPGGIVEEGGSQFGERLAGVVHLQDGGVGVLRAAVGRHVLAHDGLSPAGDGVVDKVVPVRLRPAYRYEQPPLLYAAAVVREMGDLDVFCIRLLIAQEAGVVE